MNENTKVQIRLVPYLAYSDYKAVEYRIDPSELNWFQNLFNNWIRIYEYIGDENVINPKSYYFSMLVKSGTIDEMKKKFKTLKDINDFNSYNESRLQNDWGKITNKRNANNYIEY